MCSDQRRKAKQSSSTVPPKATRRPLAKQHSGKVQAALELALQVPQQQPLGRQHGRDALAQSEQPPQEDGVVAGDQYGLGHPFDRLQFGYSPAVTAEAVAFYQQFPLNEWLRKRRENFTRAIIKKQKLKHLESLESFLSENASFRSSSRFGVD